PWRVGWAFAARRAGLSLRRTAGLRHPCRPWLATPLAGLRRRPSPSAGPAPSAGPPARSWARRPWRRCPSPELGRRPSRRPCLRLAGLIADLGLGAGLLGLAGLGHRLIALGLAGLGFAGHRLSSLGLGRHRFAGLGFTRLRLTCYRFAGLGLAGHRHRRVLGG